MKIKKLPNFKLKRFKITRRKRFIALGILIVALAAMGALKFLPVKKAFAAPWAATMSGWDKRKQLTLVNTSGQTLHASSPYTITVNTSGGSKEANCYDVIVFYQPSETVATQLPTYAHAATGAVDCKTSTATSVTFPLQTDLANAATSSYYYVYYGNSSATVQTGSLAPLSAFNVNTKSATFVAPFMGDTTALAAGSGTPTTATGAIRYSGGKSALSFDGSGDSVAVTNNSTLQFITPLTVEFWYKPQILSAAKDIVAKGGWGGGGYRIWRDSATAINFRLYDGSGCPGNITGGSLVTGQWYHIAGTWDGTTQRLFINGVQVASGQPSQPTTGSSNLSIGGESSFIDEVRISNVARYTSNFTPQTSPFVRDGYTKLLYHFDENGTDPRGGAITYPAFDDSGNGNNGTITGATYVGGLVGVDNSATTTGYQSSQPVGGHQGVFIEEGTTNKVTNPSFENSTSFSTNWLTASGVDNYSTTNHTFTPAIAKRTPPAGPFAAGVMVQSKGDDGTSTPDVLSFPNGNQVSGNFYTNFDTTSGAVTLWWTPEFAYNATGLSGLHYLWYINANYYLAYDYSNARYQLAIGGQTVTSASNIAAGTTYGLVSNWDTQNPLSGSNYLCFTIDDGTPACGTTQPTASAPASALYVGSNGTAGGINGLIQGLTVYRRPLYDGANGINVGNGDEVSKIKTTGGTDPTLTTGSWDVVFALPTNQTVGTLGTTGEAWSHPHSSNLLGGTNGKFGFMMDGTYTNDGFTSIGVGGTDPTIAALATAEKIFAGGYKVTSDGITANQGIGATFPATSGQDFVVRAIGNSDGTSVPTVVITRADDTEITRIAGSIGTGRTAPDTLIFTFESPATENLKIKLINTAASGTTYWHQVEVQSNKIKNPSFETGWSGADPNIPTSWTNSGLTSGQGVDETLNKHSGNNAFRMTVSTAWAIRGIRYSIPVTSGTFTSEGYFGIKISGGAYFGLTYNTLNYYYQNLSYTGNSTKAGPLSSDSSWKHTGAVMRPSFTGTWTDFGLLVETQSTGGGDFIYDDIYAFNLTPVTLTVTPATESNSTEASGLRVDGRDYLTMPVANLTASSGSIEFKFTPRRSYATAVGIGSTAPVIAEAYGNSNNYLKVYWQSATNLRLDGKFNGGTTISANYATPTLNAGTTYTFKITYLTSGNLALYVDDMVTAKGTVAMSTNAFLATAIPATMFFGSDDTGANQYDATFDTATITSPTLTANTTAPYYKFGAQSASLVNTDASNVVSSLTPASTAAHTLSAYVYDGTSGNVGGTVDSKVASLVFDGEAVSTTYTDTGGGWWRLSYTPTYTGKVASYNSLNQDSDQGLYKTASDKWLSQGFKTSQTVTADTVNLYLKKIGSGTPTTTHYQVTVQGDSAGVPDGNIAATSNCKAVVTSTSYAQTPFTFASPPTLTSGTQYHLVIKPYTENTCVTQQAALNATNYISWGYDTSASSYGSGDRSTGTGSAWTAIASSDHIFQVFSPQATLNYGVHSADSKTVYVDGVQLEAKAYATSYTDGSLGGSYAWTGTANNSTSTRTIAQLKYSAASSLSNTAGTVSFWLKRPYSFTPPGNGMGLFGAYNWAGGTGLSMYYNSSNLLFDNAGGSGGASKSVSFTAGQWFHVVGTWDNSVPQLNVYVNAAVGSTGNGTIGTLTANFSLDDVANTTTGRPSDAVISDFRIFNTALTTTDVSDLYYMGLASHQEQVVASEAYSDGTPPILNWHMDETNGTTVYDSSIYQNNGTLGTGSSAPSWETGIVVNSQNPASLKFDGSNDYVSRAYTQDSEMDVGTASFSVSGWFHHSSTISGTDTFISRYSSGGYKVYMNSSGYMCFGIDSDATWTPTDSACSTVSYADSKWHYLEAVKNGVSTITLYIDGLQVAQTNVTDTSSLSGSSPAFYVGIDSDGVSNPWDGYIDEIKVFDIARTLAQAKTGTIGVESVKGVSAQFGGEDPNKSLSQGLVGWWKMDENTGTTTVDGSGNANTGTLGVGSSAPSWGAGKFGSGLTFDGTDDYVNVPYAATTFTSISTGAWIKPNTITGSHRVIINEQTGDTLWVILNQDGSSKLDVYLGDSSNKGFHHSTATISTGSWTHIFMTYNSTTSTLRLFINGSLDSTFSTTGSLNFDSFSIGRREATAMGYFNGSIDDVRIYNRALSPAEVLQLYKFAPGPVGWWKLDEGSGLSALDSSGNGNTGTWYGTGSSHWAAGKIGKAGKFDGSTDYIKTTSASGFNPDQGTMSLWVYPSFNWNDNIYHPFIQNGIDGSSWIHGVRLLKTDSDQGNAILLGYNGSVATCKSTYQYSSGSWFYLTTTWEGSGTNHTGKIYINGVLNKSCSFTNGAATAYAGYIAGWDWNASRYHLGKLDDIRIYNYARTQEQIVEDMIGSPKSVGGGGGTSQPAVAYYKFDEGQGTTANNFGNGGSTYNGTLGVGSSAPSWSNSGKYGKALSFDGSNDYAYTSNVAVVASNSQTYSSVSWGGWFNPSTGVAAKTLIHKGNEFKLTTDANSKANCAIYSTTWQTASVASSALPLSSWSHVLCTYDGVNIKVYVNGNQSGTTPAQTGLITSVNTTPLNIGREPSTNYYQGFIDEVKIYTYALSSDEVKIEYNQGTAQVLGALGTNTSYQPQAGNQEYCVPGDSTSCAAPVGEWKMDEKNGNYARDTSGNNYDGYLGNGTVSNMPIWANGKLGSGLKFDGVNDEVRVADNDAFSFTNGTNDLPFTLSSWVYYKAGGGTAPSGAIISKYYSLSPFYGEWSLVVVPASTIGSAGSDQLYFQVNDDSHIVRLQVESQTSIPKNQWVFVTATYDGSGVNTGLNLYFNGQLMAVDRQTQGTYIKMSNLAGPVQIGGIITSDALYNSYLNGSLDQVRIFNYARTPAQIAWDYNRGAPVAWYKFDECTGSTIHSTNDPYNSTLNGTLTIGATVPQSSAGTCGSGVTTEAWNNGTTGKFGASLNLDGVDDKVTITDTANLRFDTNTLDFSLFAWVKRSAVGAIHYVMSKEDADNDGWRLIINADNTVSCSVNTVDVTSTGTIDTNWHLIGCTITRAGNGQVYIDGLPNGTATAISSATMATTSNITLGTRSYTSTNYFAGQIDDARIYNYALTGTQAKALMNQDSALRFGQ